MKEIQGRPLPLGTTMIGEVVNFSVAVPQEKECQLLIYRAGAKKPYAVYEMKRELGEVRYLALEGIIPSKFEYNYRIGGEVVQDPYAGYIRGTEIRGADTEEKPHAVRCAAVTDRFSWQEDEPLEIPYEDCKIDYL